MNRSIVFLSIAVFNWVRCRSTVGAGLADNLCLQTHKLSSKPAPTKDVLHPLANCYKSNTRKRLQVLSLVGILSLTACQSPPTQLQTQNLASLPRTLTVSGRGNVTIPTTKTQVRLGVEVQGKTAQEVQQQVAQKSSAVVELLKSRQVEKLETTGINLNPVYSYENSKQTIAGYSGTNIVSFRIETQKSGNLIDEAIKAGATRVDGISFVASEEAIAQAQQQAIDEATQNAKKQADAALNTLNLKQQEIVGIQINAANPPVPPPRPYDARLAQVAKESAATPVIGGEQEIEASVTLQIRY